MSVFYVTMHLKCLAPCPACVQNFRTHNFRSMLPMYVHDTSGLSCLSILKHASIVAEKILIVPNCKHLCTIILFPIRDKETKLKFY